ncbi:hypothetical protein V7S43_008899 [Phytophthora oleae]|uniref:EF-hand domain-containing protein n=1 Tax=Phytophthora oleae TaxID=2107226 RepID=A0ABD3FGN1_9STRA
MAFYWECETFPVAVAPWQSDPKLQRTVRARVAVAEQWTPGFALRFDLELLGAEKQTECRLMRLVSQRQMLRAFEFAFVGAGAEKRRPPGGEADELLDLQLKKWLAGGGQVLAPPKEELAKWLLAWMVVSPTESDKQPDEWLVLMCGEKGAEKAEESEDHLAFDESGDANEPVSDDNNEIDGNSDDASEEDTEEDDLPPPYEPMDFQDDIGSNGRERTTRRKTNDSSRSLRIQDLTKLSKRSFTGTSSTLAEKSELKPSIVRLNPRSDSLDVGTYEEQTSEWSADRKHFHQELKSSRRAVQMAKQQRDKVEKLAHLRHSQLLKESALKLRANDEKRRDAQAVRQLKADTLEYRDELNAMESRVKKASIAAHRDQERVKRQVRVVVGNTENSPRGALKGGPGPPSKQERELLVGDTRFLDESAVYDLHGRRHSLEKADLIAKTLALESAIRKVRRLLNSGKSVDIIRRYDLDRSGTLSYSEFQRMLRENGTGDSAELTQEQSVAFFKRFDTDSNGEVNYKELLWGFFNWEAFIKRWHERKNAPTDRQVRQLFRKYDPTGRGVLPLKEFQLVLDHLGVSLGDINANLLSAKFDAGKDGYIDYHKLLESVNNSDLEDASSGRCQSAPLIDSHTVTASSGMGRIWMELQELSTTQAKLHRLLQK